MTKTNTLQNIFRILLGTIMLYAGISHLTFNRTEFLAQVPTWLTTEHTMMDLVVVISGIIEIIFGLMMIIGGKFKVKTGVLLAIFYVLIFPGNINQYIHHINSFGLDTDKARLIRMFFQPVLILWALWSSGALAYWKNRNKYK